MSWSSARSTITGDDGISPSRASGWPTRCGGQGWLRDSRSGATRPGRPDVRFHLAPATSGGFEYNSPAVPSLPVVVRDPAREPASVPSFSCRERSPLGQANHRLRPVPGINIVTDDRGEYRAFGLPAGSYVVAAIPRGPGVPGDIATVSREEVERALAEVKERRISSRPGMPAPARSTPPAPPRTAGLSFAPTYYPGPRSRSSPAPTVRRRVRTGVDFDLDYGPIASISGSVAVPPGTRSS